LENVFNSTIAASVGVAVFGVIVNQMMQAKRASEELSKSIDDLFKQARKSSQSGDIGGLTTAIEKQIENANKKLGEFGGQEQAASTFAEINKLLEDRAGMMWDLAAREAEMAQAEAAGNKDKAAALKADIDLSKQITAIRLDDLLTTDQKNAAIKAAIASSERLKQITADVAADELAFKIFAEELADIKQRQAEEDEKHAQQVKEGNELEANMASLKAQFEKQQNAETAARIDLLKQVSDAQEGQAKAARDLLTDQLSTNEAIAQAVGELEALNANQDMMTEAQRAGHVTKILEKEREIAGLKKKGNEESAEADKKRIDKLKTGATAFSAEAQSNVSHMQAGFTLPQIRNIEKKQQQELEKQAGIESRDWARRKYKKNIDELLPEERAAMNARKAAGAGKGNWEKDIANTAKDMAELRKAFNQYADKVGAK
jgi:hypothetical protein